MNMKNEDVRQKLSDLEDKLLTLDLDKISSKKGSKLKDRMNSTQNDLINKRISAIEEILDDMTPDDLISSKKGSKLKDR